MIALLLLGCNGVTVFTDANNYSFTSSIESGSIPIASRTDLPVQWGDLAIDLQDRAVDPLVDVDVLTIAILSLGQQEALDAFVNDALLASDIVAYATCQPADGLSEVMLSDFDFIGNPVIPEEHVTPGQGTWLLSATTNGNPGARMLTFFDPQDGGPEDPIVLADDSASLSYTVDLSAGTPMHIEGTKVDWSDLETDMRGLPIRLSEITRLSLAHYDEDLSEIEAHFLEIEDLAEETWQADFESTVSYDLGELVSDQGNSFNGVRGGGTWLFALRCMACSNPAPPFLVALE